MDKKTKVNQKRFAIDKMDNKKHNEEVCLCFNSDGCIEYESKKALFDEIENHFLVQRNHTEPLIVIHWESEWAKLKKRHLGDQDEI